MKKIKLFSILFVLLFVSLFAFTACNSTNGEGNNDSQGNETQILILNKEKVTLEKLESVELYPFNSEDDTSNVKWTSSLESVASVSDGVVHALSAGVTVITAELDDKIGKCIITVEDHELIPDIKTNIVNDVLYLTKGDLFDVDSSFIYNNKEYDVKLNVSVNVVDNSIIFNDGTISAVNNGSATIIFSTEWEGISVEKFISVNVVDNIIASLDDTEEIMIFNDSRAGKTEYTLSPKVYLDEKLLDDSEFVVDSWKFDDDIVSINTDTYTVKGLKKGTTNLTALIRTVNAGITVESNISVVVGLYNEDKSDNVTLDTLYLDEDDYYLSMKEIFKDKSNRELNNLEITSVTDVTSGLSFTVPFNKVANDYIVDIFEVIRLGLTGDRKWQIECGKYSYIVSLPINENNPAKPLVGTYDTEIWDYKVVIKYEKNKQLVEFISKKTGALIDKGTYYLSPWKGNTDNGTIRIVTERGTIPGMRDKNGNNFIDTKLGKYSVRGYYFDLNGSEQISFALGGGNTYDKHVYKDLEDPTKYLVGEFTSILFAGKIKLNSDLTCNFILKDKNVSGTYELTPTAPFKGKVTLTFTDEVFSGQKILQGTYTYSKDGAEFTFNANGIGDLTMRFGSNVYEQYAGYYRPNGDWKIPMRFLADGTCIFDYVNWSGFPSIGTYTLEDGVLKITVEQSYSGLKNYTGTYEMRDGKRCFVFIIAHASKDEPRVFVQQDIVN